MFEDKAEYWTSRYTEGNFPWDLGHASPPLVEYMAGLEDKSLRILIPGGGYGHDLAWCHANGFVNAVTLDFSSQAIEGGRSRYPTLPPSAFLCQDFFAHQGQYDLILEQTFFCALPPTRRDEHLAKCANLLAPGGKLVGVLFDFPLTEKGPPFGGSEAEYRQRLAPHFTVDKLERCRNSVPDRQGKELFLIAHKN